MATDFLVGYGIEFSDGGAEKGLTAVAQAAIRATEALTNLTKAAPQAAASLDRIGQAAGTAAATVNALDAALRAVSASSAGAASGASSAAAAFRQEAAAANAAATAIIRRNRAAGGAAASGFAESAGGEAATGSAIVPSLLAATMIAQSASGSNQAELSRTISEVLEARANAHELAFPGGDRGGPPRVISASIGAEGPPPALPGGGGGGTAPGGGGGGGRWGRFGAWLGGGGGGRFIGRGFGGNGYGGFGAAADMVPWGRMAHYGLIGADIAAGFGLDAAYEAGKLQRTMRLIQTGIPGAKPSDIARLEQEAYKISNLTAMSVNQVAHDSIFTSVSAGLNDPKMLFSKGKDGQTYMEKIARFADVQYLKTGGKTSFEEATKELTFLAHLYRDYTPDKVGHMADMVTKLSFMMPDDIKRYVTQAGYYAQLFGRVGVPQDESLVLGAFMDRAGQGKGKGGTGLYNFVIQSMNALQMTKHMQTGRLSALQRLGIYDARGRANTAIFGHDENGNLRISPIKMLETIDKSINDQTAHLKGQAKADKERSLLGDIKSAFNITGSRIGFLGDATGIQVLHKMLSDLNRMPDTKTAQESFIHTLPGETQRAWSNFQNMMTALGGAFVSPTQKVMTDLGDAFDNSRGWINAHRHSIAQALLDDVTMVEKYLTSHHKDWEQFRDDVMYVGSNAQKAAPLVLSVATGLGSLYENVRPLAGILDGMGKSLDDFYKYTHPMDDPSHRLVYAGTSVDGVPIYLPSTAGGGKNAPQKPTQWQYPTVPGQSPHDLHLTVHDRTSGGITAQAAWTLRRASASVMHPAHASPTTVRRH